MLYFDHAATTPLYDEVYEILCQSLKEDFANPSSKHKLGSGLSKKIEQARKAILQTLDANQYQLIFTSSATESNNQVINSFKEKGKVLYYLSDHPSISVATSDEDIFLLESDNILDKLTDDISLVVLSLVNSQAGIIKDVEKITREIKEKNPNVKVLVDAVQGYGKIPYNLKGSSIDYISIAAHKIGGARGVAALIYKDDKMLKPILRGGGHENGMRSSTPATSLILGFQKACELSCTKLESNLVNTKELNIILREKLSSLHKNIEFPFEDNCSPYILCMLFKGIPSDVLLRHLEMKDVYVSSTTACSSRIKGKNPMFVGLGIEEKFHKNVLRISMSSQTTEDEVNKLINKFEEVIKEVSFLIK